MSMKLINLTPHPVQIWNFDTMVLSIPPEDEPARCKEDVKHKGFLDSDTCTIDLVDLSYSGVFNLPPKIKGILYIVSVLVAQACPSRDDLLVPYDLVRNENGRILGCRKLARII